MTRSRNILPKRMKWTPEMDADLRRIYPAMDTASVAERMWLRVGQVSSRAFILRLLKSREYMASERPGQMKPGHAGNATSFTAGNTPWNKGASFEAGGRSIETQFKPGQRSGRATVLWRPIGSLRLTHDGTLQRKVTDTGNTARDYVSVHKLVWESAHGPAPPGHIVVFKPGMRTADLEQITLDRLELVSRAENMRRNSRHVRYPPELNSLLHVKASLTRKINSLTKGKAKP